MSGFGDPESFDLRKIVHSLDSHDPTAALKALSDVLLYWGGAFLQNLCVPLSKLTSLLCRHFSTPRAPEICELAGSCIHLLVDAESKIAETFASEGVFKTAGEYLTSFQSPELAQSCLDLITAAAREYSLLVSRNVDVVCLLTNIHRFPLKEQNKAIQTYRRIIEVTKQTKPAFAHHLPLLVPLFTHRRDSVIVDATAAFSDICCWSDLSSTDPEVMSQLAVSLLCLTDETAIAAVLAGLTFLLKFANLADRFLDSSPDFPLLFEQGIYKTKLATVLSHLLSVLLLLVPQPWGSAAGFVARKLEKSPAFAASLRPFAEQLFLQTPSYRASSLRLLSAVYRFVPPSDIAKLTDELSLCFLVRGLIRDAFLVIVNITNREVLNGSSLLPLAETVYPDGGRLLRALFGNFPAGRKPVPIAIVPDIDTFVQIVELPPGEFWLSNAALKCATFLRNFSGEISGRMAVGLEKLAQALRTLIGMHEVPEEGRPDFIVEGGNFAEANFGATVQLPDRTLDKFGASLTLEFAAWEHIFNYDTYHLPPDRAVEALRADPALSEVIRADEVSGCHDRTKSSILDRAVRPRGYQSFGITMGNRTFCVSDSIYYAYTFMAKHTRGIGNGLPVFTIAPTDDRPRYPYEIRKLAIPDVDPLLEFLREVHAKLPNVNCVCESLANVLLPRFAYSELVIARWSYAISAVWSYPFAFPLDMRVLFFKLTAFDMRSVLALQQKVFGIPYRVTDTDQIRVHCYINRDKIFEQGLLIFDRLGAGRAFIDIHLEIGHGNGPTREFFSLFSTELMVADHRLWRNTAPDDSPYVDPGPTGLFPRPTADPEVFRIIGNFCAKALFMDCLVNLPICPVFFEIAWGIVNDQTCARIDPQFVASLESPDGFDGCVFLYPDDDCEDLIPGGDEVDVTPENAGQYVQLIKERMLCRNIAAAFAEGFSAAVPWDATRVFTGEELQALLIGNDVAPFTMEHLRANVQIQHGYQDDSPQIQWLFEVLIDFDAGQRQQFVQFVTGTRFIPKGGLAGLSPGLTIARSHEAADPKVDEKLPSVSTCAQYFKMPEYSTREVLRDRLIVAIREGNTGFGLA
jgi:E3 ubiquitin-protein ligase TRIP12